MLRKIRALRRALINVARSGQSLLEIRQLLSKTEADIINERLGELRVGLENQSSLINDRFGEIQEGNGKPIQPHVRPTGKDGIPASPVLSQCQPFDDVIVLPIQPISYPLVELGSLENSIAGMLSQEWRNSRAARLFFTRIPTEAMLIRTQTQALMYTLVRNMEPRHVFEIGTYRGGSPGSNLQGPCGRTWPRGHPRDDDPFGLNTVPKIMACWPPPLGRACNLPSGQFNGLLQRRLQGKTFTPTSYSSTETQISNSHPSTLNVSPACSSPAGSVSSTMSVSRVLSSRPAVSLREKPELAGMIGEMKSSKPYDRETNERQEHRSRDPARPKGHSDCRGAEDLWTAPLELQRIFRAIVLDIGDKASGSLHVQCVLRTSAIRWKAPSSRAAFSNCGMRWAGLRFQIDHPMAFTNRSQSDTS